MNSFQLVQESHHTEGSKYPPINVVDSIMGSGKTSWAIQFMENADKDKNFLYITPFLDETKRIKESVKSREFVTPETKGKGKMKDLKQLILNEKNIASTHALFERADNELIELLKSGKYTLILDEAITVIEQFDLEKDSFQQLQDSQMVFVDETTGLIKWNEEGRYQDTPYNRVKNLAKTENLYFFENTVLFWTFPVTTFQAFEEVYILTYLFQAQQQKHYYDMYDVQYTYKAVQRINETYVLVNHENKNSYDKSKLKSLINIYEGKLNNIGDDKNAFSVSWFNKVKNKNLIVKLKNNTYSYFKNNVKTPASLNMWTSYKADTSKLKGKGYTKGFVPCNARATNEYKDKESLAYLVNRFMHPYEYKFFKAKNIEVNQDMYALSELLQWIWRSRIRNGEPINLYIPSKRMRTLLIDYLESDL